MLIRYSSSEEVLICTSEAEPILLKQWFAKDTGRDLEDFDREESPADTTIIEIKSAGLVAWSYDEAPVK